jgi:hypothetical protein
MLTRESGEILIPSADDSTLFDESDLSERCETLIDFLQSICQSPAQNLLLSTNKELFLRSLSKSGVQGSHNHNPQTYLLHLLSAPLSVPACVQDSVTAPLILYILVQQNCQLAALLYISAALFDFQRFPLQRGDFVTMLYKHLLSQNLSQEYSSELLRLYWILFTGSLEPQHDGLKRPWLVGRLMNVVKRLNPDTRDKVKQVLLGFLGVSDRGGDGAFSDLSAVQIRREIRGVIEDGK